MDYFPLIFIGIFVLIAGRFVLGRFKYGSWTGSFLKGTIDQTHGEVELSRGLASSQLMKVVTLREDGGGEFVGLVITAKAPLAASMQPFRLSKDQAQELARLLTVAAR
jgi:hypothetical protein